MKTEQDFDDEFRETGIKVCIELANVQKKLEDKGFDEHEASELVIQAYMGAILAFAVASFPINKDRAILFKMINSMLDDIEERQNEKL